jgi:hypothetical protein
MSKEEEEEEKRGEERRGEEEDAYDRRTNTRARTPTALTEAALAGTTRPPGSFCECGSDSIASPALGDRSCE